jgi:hypothetical protein
MNIKDIKERIQAIELMKGDSEAAHAAEDDLYEGFVKFIANCDGNGEKDAFYLPRPVRAMAEEILKTKNIKFTRHCS